MLRTLFALALLALPLATALPSPGIVAATGPGSHHYETTGVCDDPDATWLVQYSRPQETIVVASDSRCVEPYWATVGGCRGGAGTDIVCARPGVHATLRADGAFRLTWQGSDFYEEIVASLMRTDV